MKKTLLLTLLAVGALTATFTSCKKDEPGEKSSGTSGNETIQTEKSFVGIITVESDKEPFKKEDVKCHYTITSENTLTISLEKVKFAENMPVELDINIEGVTYQKVGEGKLLLSGDGLVPKVGDNPFERYTVSKLSGVVERLPNDKKKGEWLWTLYYSLQFGSFPTTYAGSTDPSSYIPGMFLED